MTTAKPSPYTLFRLGKGNRFTVLQTRTINGGKAVNVLNLTCYAAVKTIQAPWWKITIGPGSRMLLAADAAAELLSEGMIEPILSETLIPWRQGHEARQSERFAARKKISQG